MAIAAFQDHLNSRGCSNHRGKIGILRNFGGNGQARDGGERHGQSQERSQ
jgi:hypothetical protein